MMTFTRQPEKSNPEDGFVDWILDSFRPKVLWQHFSQKPLEQQTCTMADLLDPPIFYYIMRAIDGVLSPEPVVDNDNNT